MAMATKLKIILCPFPASGHINPMMVLAKRLAELNLSVVVVIAAVPSVNYYNPQVDGLVIEKLDIHGEIPSRVAVGLRNIRFPQPSDMLLFGENSKQAIVNKVEEMMYDEFPPELAIVDINLHDGCSAISKLLPIYILKSASAVQHLFETGFPTALRNEGRIVVQGLPPLYSRDIPSYYNDPTSWFHKLRQEADYDMKVILFNTSRGLELGPAEVLAEVHKVELRLVGPLIVPASGKLDEQAQKCRAWLDTKPPGSVIFVSFGSWIPLSDEQALEIALGLEQSKKTFLWAVPSGTELPRGFQGRTMDQGMVMVGWTPQQLILQHASIGAFLTHCGWNSIQECLLFAGVPMVGWPLIGDQLINCRYLVDGLKVGLEVIGESEDGFVRRDEVDRVVSKIMGHDLDVVAMRDKAKALKERLVVDQLKQGMVLESLVEEFKLHAQK